MLKYYFEKYPEDANKVVLCIKGAFGARTGPDGSPEGTRASVDEAIKVLGGSKTIDIFECARVDPKVPVETSIGTLVELVKEGKIRPVIDSVHEWEDVPDAYVRLMSRKAKGKVVVRVRSD